MRLPEVELQLTFLSPFLRFTHHQPGQRRGVGAFSVSFSKDQNNGRTKGNRLHWPSCALELHGLTLIRLCLRRVLKLYVSTRSPCYVLIELFCFVAKKIFRFGAALQQTACDY